MTPNHRSIAALGLMFLARQEGVGASRIEDTSRASRTLQAPGSSRLVEYQVKARCVSLLPDYIKWPSNGPEGRPIVIGVVGDSLFENYLNDLFTPGSPLSRKGRLMYLQARQSLETCDVLFICDSESERLYEILRRIKGRPILTVADSPDFARRGVMINLVLDRDRIALEINLNALRASGLEVSPHILKNAKIIE
jgi:hypothetical protein